MKLLKNSFLFIIAALVFSCDPDNKDIFITEFVKVNATVESNAENINQGDTLKIKLKVPDTVTTSSGSQLIQSLQRAQFGMYIHLIDTTNKKSVLMRTSNVWLTKGTREGDLSYVTNNNIKPYEININFKPPEKGLYRLQIISQPGQFRINNNYEARLLVNFDVPNKHFNILEIIAPYFGGQPYYDAFVQRDAEGFGTYFFRVE